MPESEVSTPTLTKKTLPLPANDRLLILPPIHERKTKGGVILAPKVKSDHRFAVVLAAGPNVKHVQPGDIVAFNQSEGSPLPIGSLFDVNTPTVLAIIEDDVEARYPYERFAEACESLDIEFDLSQVQIQR